jgi:death-on-curing protein
MRYLTLNEVLELYHRIMEQSGGSVGIHNLDALESALAQPRMTFGREELYATLVEKAAALGFSLIKNHPFVDGNKRTGHAAMEVIAKLSGVFEHREQAAIFTTVEPCYLCFGAILVARIGHVFFAAPDVNFGAGQIRGAGRYDRPRILTFEGGILESEAFELLYRHSERHCRLLFGERLDALCQRVGQKR